MANIPAFDFARIPRISGHRGAKGSAPENTLASMRQAASLGVTFVEFDVNLAADEIVAFHDYTLERCTDGSGTLADTSYSTLSSLDAGGYFSAQFVGESIPRFVDVVDTLGKLGIGANVELKSQSGYEPRTVDLAATVINQCWPAQLPILLSSFNETVMQCLRDTLPAVSRGWLVEEVPNDWREKLALFTASSLHCNSDFLTHQQVESVLDAGYPVLVYTVNDRARAKELFDWGVSSVISDHPERLLGL